MEEVRAQGTGGAGGMGSAAAALRAPPTVPGPLGSTGREPAWARVFGILSIVLGGLAVLQGIVGVLSAFFAGNFFGLIPGGQQMKAAMDQNLPLNVGLQFAVALLGVTNLIAGIDLIRRRPRGVRWLKGWAVCKIAFAPVSAAVSYYVQQGMMTAAPQGSTGPPPPAVGAMVAVGVVFGVLWAWAYPVTALVWLARPQIKAQIRSWDVSGAPSGAPMPDR